jgi:hypothetical protein
MIKYTCSCCVPSIEKCKGMLLFTTLVTWPYKALDFLMKIMSTSFIFIRNTAQPACLLQLLITIVIFTRGLQCFKFNGNGRDCRLKKMPLKTYSQKTMRIWEFSFLCIFWGFLRLLGAFFKSGHQRILNQHKILLFLYLF